MADEVKVEAPAAVDDNAFDPGALDDAALKEFLGLAEPAPAVSGEPPEGNEEVSDEAAQGALESALADGEAETQNAPTSEPAVAAAPAPAPSAAAPEKKPAYVAYGEDGKPLEAVPIKEIEITVAGKQKRVDLEKLARMASSGGYNEQLQAEVAATRAQLPELQTTAQKWQQYAQQLEQERHAILADPDTYLKHVEQFAQAQSPEARAARAEARVNELSQAQQAQQSQQYIEQAAQQHIMPKFDAIFAQYPHVKPEEVIGQFETLIRPYRAHGGPIPPQLIPHVLEIIDRAIEPYAAQLHDAREEKAKATATTTAATQATQSATATTTKAQATVTKAKAELARTIAPIGRVAARPAKPKAPPQNANEAADRALDDALNFALGT